jgi:hypothetical protein
MGAKNPNLWTAGDWREHFERVELMRKARWRVWATCRTCKAWWEIDLLEVEQKLGPNYSLWGRSPTCRVITMCHGKTKLTALPPRVTRPFELVGPRRRQSR